MSYNCGSQRKKWKGVIAKTDTLGTVEHQEAAKTLVENYDAAKVFGMISAYLLPDGGCRIRIVWSASSSGVAGIPFSAT